MSGLVNPKECPEESAYALLIELVRAQMIPACKGDDISNMLAMYDQAVEHFKKEGEKNPT